MKPYCLSFKNHYFIGCLIFIWIDILSINAAKCQIRRDTIVYYFKYGRYDINIRHYARVVKTLDSADYFRVILPPTDGERKLNVKEFYKNGKIKLIGKVMPEDTMYDIYADMKLDGYCATYYPDGKKESIINYSRGRKSGDEYLFYPTGRVYSYRKNLIGVYNNTSLWWECYNENGDMTCKDGNGMWLIYDIGYKGIIMRGGIKNGLPDGEWHGNTLRFDSIKYVFLFKNGELKKAIGYDKNGTSFPFDRIAQEALYKGGPTTFIQSVRNHLKWPRDENGRKISIDTMHISFVVEKNGQLSQFDVLGEIKPAIKEALIASLEKCSGWAPAKYYGVPFRTQIILPMSYTSEYEDNSSVPPPSIGVYQRVDNFHIEVKYYERLLDFKQTSSSVPISQ